MIEWTNVWKERKEKRKKQREKKKRKKKWDRDKEKQKWIVFGRSREQKIRIEKEANMSWRRRKN